MSEEIKKTSGSRREFLQASAATGATAALMATGNYAHAQGSGRLKIGLIGCGGRGTGAAMQALNADPENYLVSMGDVLKSQIDSSLTNIKGVEAVSKRVTVSPDQCFVGLDAYQKVIDSGVDVVVLASPPGFRPREIAAAVAAGKHVFAEKPMGSDPVNVLAALEAAKAAKAKKLAFVAGFCWRYEPAHREFFKRIHEGAIGDIRHYYATYLAGPVKPMPPAENRPAGMSDVEWQIRNWYNFVWLSGDGLVEQACHSVDKVMWAMKDVPPVKCTATGGRMIPNNQGNIFDHITVCYEWADGTRATMAQRQIEAPHYDNSDFIAGSKYQGVIRGGRPTILAEKKWRYEGQSKDMYQLEHDEMFASIRRGEPLNNAERMATSTLAALMGRTAAYTGAELSWDQFMKSKQDLFPKPLTWDMSLPIAPMAMPGRTPVV